MSTTGQLPFSDVLLQIGQELAGLGRALTAVEQAVAQLLECGDAPDHRALYGLQTIDLLGQSLMALADFACDLSAEVPQSWALDVRKAAGKVKLQALAERLNAAHRSASTDVAILSNDVDLFDEASLQSPA